MSTHNNSLQKFVLPTRQIKCTNECRHKTKGAVIRLAQN